MILGIDCGLDGAVAILAEDGMVQAVHVVPTRTFIKRSSKGHKRVYDLRRMIGLIEGWRGEIKLTVLEHAQAMPSQGVTSTFSIGYGFGLWQGLLSALGVPYVTVRPMVWHRALCKGLSGSAKQQAWQYVTARYPSLDLKASERCKRPHDGIVDAMCLATYGISSLRGHNGKEEGWDHCST